jgi:pyridoxal phosphate enzyme (YggS family)
MSLSERFDRIKTGIPDSVELVAVSKTYPIEVIQEAYNYGQRVFGENRVQELVAKYEALPKNIQWHLIGHLQKNKVKYIAPFVHLIHGVDTLELLLAIEKEGKKINRKIPCLLQVHIAKEETKFGFNLEDIHPLITQKEVA